MNGGNTSGKITVLLVDDSPVVLTVLKRILAPCADIEVVGTARNGSEALELIPKLSPRVICTDLHMPVMDGLELTREVMNRFPTPILVVSVSVKDNVVNVFKVLEAGAVDVYPKPQGVLEGEYCDQRNGLAQKIRILAGVSVVRRRRRIEAPSPPPSNGELAAVSLKIVAIGASTGGPVALQRVLSALPSSFPIPIVCVQHISDGFLQGLVEWLGSVCDLKVGIAQEGWQPLPGTVYFPPEGTHLLFDAEGRFRYSREQAVNGHRPSVSRTFESAAGVFGGAVIGVLLTGMGNDGADGMKAIHDAGGITIAQDEKTSVVFGMPKQAIEKGAAKIIAPLDEIPRLVAGFVRRNGTNAGGMK